MNFRKKQCDKCNMVLPKEDFGVKKIHTDGYRRFYKTCKYCMAKSKLPLENKTVYDRNLAVRFWLGRGLCEESAKTMAGIKGGNKWIG